MSTKIGIEVYPNSDSSRWFVKKRGNQRASYGFDTYEQAETKAKHLSMDARVKMVVTGESGKIKKKIDNYDRPGLRNFHVLKKDRFWIVKASDRKQAKHQFKSKQDAIRRAKIDASNHCSMVVIHDPNGRIMKVQDLRGNPAPK